MRNKIQSLLLSCFFLLSGCMWKVMKSSGLSWGKIRSQQHFSQVRGALVRCFGQIFEIIFELSVRNHNVAVFLFKFFQNLYLEMNIYFVGDSFIKALFLCYSSKPAVIVPSYLESVFQFICLFFIINLSHLANREAFFSSGVGGMIAYVKKRICQFLFHTGLLPKIQRMSKKTNLL